MRRPADDALDRMRDRLLHGRGDVDRATRQAAVEGGPVPAPVGALLDKVRLSAYKVTDADIDGALAAGWTQRQLFELIVAAAAGTGLHRRTVLDDLLAEHPAADRA